MKKIVASFFAAVVTQLAWSAGVVYTWNGGVSGTWNTPGNWLVGSETATAVPNAGDVALFNATAEITDDIEIAEGQLAISNAASTTVSLKGVISGAGGLTKGDDGSLKLYGDNTFTGVFESDGTGNGNADSRDSSLVTIYHPNALGLTRAKFDQKGAYSLGRGSRLFLDGTYTNSFVFTIPIDLTGDQPSKRSVVAYNYATNIVFKELVTSKCRIDIKPNVSSQKLTVVFEKGFQATNYHFFDDGFYHFKGPINGTFYPAYSATIYLYSDANSYGEMSFNCPVYCMNTNALSRSSNAYYGFGDSAIIHLNGFDQEMTLKAGKNFGQPNGTGFGFESPVENPAQIRLVGATPVQPNFRGLFRGAAGLYWAPTDVTREFVFSNTVQTTKGVLTAEAGIIRFKNGAATTQLGELAVGATGQVIVEGSAGDLIVSNVTVAAGGTVNPAAGRRIVCKALTVGGVEKGLGEYTKANLPDVITGDGVISVNPYPENVWQGANGGLWSDDANWSLGRAPQANDNVFITTARRVLLASATPKLTDFQMSGGATLVFTNGWDVCVEADTVSLADANVTCGGPFSNETEKVRVHFKARNFSMNAGATIDVSGRGWYGGGFARIWGKWDSEKNKNYNMPYTNHLGISRGGFGPGCAKTNMGAAHFGYGSPLCTGTDSGMVYSPYVSCLYDDPKAPTEPGSGGFGLMESAYGAVPNDPENVISTAHGGGAVFIEATGTVVIDGTIKANGTGSYIANWYYCDGPWRTTTAGSGGSIRITGETVAGSGTLTANGGNGSHSIPWGGINTANGLTSTGGAGGGGGIAITYDAAKQVAGACAGMTISAGAGTYPALPNQTGAKKTEVLTYATMDKWRRDAEPGTVYFTDRKLVDDTIGHGLTGKLFDVAEYEYDGDLDWSWGNVRFGATGAVFRVTGDLTVTGAWSRVDIGGTTKITNRCTRMYVASVGEPVKLEVGGSLTVSNGAALAVYAADVAGADGYGAQVNVTGAFRVGAGGFVNPYCENYTGVAPTFNVGSFVVEEGGTVNADGRGFSGGWGAGDYGVAGAQGLAQTGRGPGAGQMNDSGATGAGHGGRGGQSLYGTGVPVTESETGATYDSARRPLQAGSGGGVSGFAWGCDGGGVVNVKAAGAIEIAGTVTANAARQEYHVTANMHRCGAGSGGSIQLDGATITGAATAVLSARGGESYVLGKAYETTQAAGGGGRVAFWTGADAAAGGRKALPRYAAGAADPLLSGTFSWAGTVDVGGGTNVVSAAIAATEFVPDPISRGKDGTVTYNKLIVAPGLLYLIK